MLVATERAFKNLHTLSVSGAFMRRDDVVVMMASLGSLRRLRDWPHPQLRKGYIEELAQVCVT